MATADAAPGLTLNVELAGPTSAPEVAFSVYPTPLRLIERFEKVATPATAFVVVVPLSTPVPGGLVPMTTVTGAVEVDTTLPSPSRISTVTAGEIEAPAVTALGWLTKATEAGAPGVMLNAALVSGVSAPPVAASVYPVPGRLSDSPGNVASPAVAPTVATPLTVAVPGFAASARVIEVAAVVTRFPAPSTTSTWGAWPSAEPAAPLPGCTAKLRAAGVPAVSAISPEVAPEPDGGVERQAVVADQPRDRQRREGGHSADGGRRGPSQCPGA